MSWSISKSGTQDEVKQAVAADAHVPDPVEGAIGAILDLFDPARAVTLNTHGHVDTEQKTGNVTITISV